MCTWGMWSENLECRIDTHGAIKKNSADSVVGNHSLKLSGYSHLLRENQGKGKYTVLMEKFHIFGGHMPS